MKKITIIISFALSMVLLTGCSKSNSTSATTAPDEKTNNYKVVNRVLLDSASDSNIISVDAKEGAGLVIIQDEQFSNGAIELEIRGENNPGRSFVGFAFNIQDDETNECVYFRPFNFRSEDANRRSHSVQYVYHPEYPWKRLRDNHEGVYESEFNRRPDPDSWFKVMIMVGPTHVTVIDSENNEELLKVKRLTTQSTETIGYWVGHNSKGQFRNLKLTRS